MPAKAFTGGAISNKLYKDYAIRRYGFHGTSHYYVSREAAQMLDKPIEQASFISVHLATVLLSVRLKTERALIPQWALHLLPV